MLTQTHKEAVFRFIQNRDSNWRKQVLQTDEVDPQWRQVMRLLGIDVTFALSPQAKGKIERPYRWLQDRIVRTCAIEKLSTIEEGRAVLRDEVNRYCRLPSNSPGVLPNNSPPLRARFRQILLPFRLLVHLLHDRLLAVRAKQRPVTSAFE